MGRKGLIIPVDASYPNAACYVGAGTPYPDGSELRIVDPVTCESLPEGRVGEIWIDGPSKARGYFRDEERTAQAFSGRIRGEENSGQIWFRSSGTKLPSAPTLIREPPPKPPTHPTQISNCPDQGFVYKGQLFYTGRLRDLIVVNGRTIYPDSVEYGIEINSDDLLKPGCSGAFALQAR